MHRYGITSYGDFITRWTRGQVYLAIDGIFWNSPLEKERYGPVPHAVDFSNVRAADFMSAIGLPVPGNG